MPQATAALELSDGSLIAKTPYVMNKVNGILQAMEEKPFGHFVVRGSPGCGKMTLIRLADHLVHRNSALEP